ncbi:MAG TPA: DUF3109 family protein [Flavobacteriaceae bacterium]|nr:DUF3109 family protein [Flavobacteriaceae bacterium]
MFQIGKTIVSDDILEKEFVCNLAKCKGECCVSGEAGAPVEPEETTKLDEIFENVKPFLRPEGIATIEQQGRYITNPLGEYETPLVNGAECAYVVFDEKGIAGCGIENAYNAGATDFKKPISCHLYPVRIQNYSQFSAVNYHSWDICNAACILGKELKVPVYKFLKEALIRKFGQEWYDELLQVAYAQNEK